ENFLRLIRRVERFLRRFACAHPFAIFSLGIRDLQSRRVAPDQTSHIECRRPSVNRTGVDHFCEQWQPSRMIEMAVRKDYRVERAVRSRWRTIQRLRFFAALKQAAVDKNAGLLRLNDVTRTGYFAARCANENDLYHDSELVILYRLK